MWLPLIRGLKHSHWIVESSRQVASMEGPADIRTKDSWLGPFKGKCLFPVLVFSRVTSAQQQVENSDTGSVYLSINVGLVDYHA